MEGSCSAESKVLKGAGGSLGTARKDCTATASSGRKVQRRVEGFEGFEGGRRQSRNRKKRLYGHS